MWFETHRGPPPIPPCCLPNLCAWKDPETIMSQLLKSLTWRWVLRYFTESPIRITYSLWLLLEAFSSTSEETMQTWSIENSTRFPLCPHMIKDVLWNLMIQNIPHIQSECGESFVRILLVPHNTVMDLNDVMLHLLRLKIICGSYNSLLCWKVETRTVELPRFT